MTGQLRYDAESLRAFAATCEQHAVDVCICHLPATPATHFQATADAVADLHSAASRAGDVLAERIRSIASAIVTAADQYSATEVQSTRAIEMTVRTDSSE